ncbi:hypothetical protein NP493_525g06064 [Ridgeia piscesae]|uniref:DNA helicase n=1 Tax=Ridgeia piscesae TaxID=27915 RepID=A0AAD9NSB8_RIDPI|nr:hypothetical protein NP493_525g06064 [Ridgeia piscesae]
MFTQQEEEEFSPFELCIKCAKVMIQNKIISSDKDLLGIVFYGTKKSENPGEFKHVSIFHGLDQPGAQSVLDLQALLQEQDNNDFKDKFGHCDNYSLSDALWTCASLFSNCTQKLGFKRVMLFTNNDNPHGNNEQLKRQAIVKSDDLHQNGIEIELMHINKPGRTFDVDLFFKDMLFADEDDDVVLPDAAEKFDELLTRVRAKDHKKRAISKIPFSLGGALDMSVGVYSLVRTCTKPTGVKLYKKTNEEVKSSTRHFLQETGEILMPQDMKKSITYANKQICFEPEEVVEIKKFDDPGLKLMGFKPTCSLKRYYHIRPAQFIYPDEGSVKGSTTLFTAMLKKCLEKDKVAICRYIPRKNTPPRFVVLLPQAEELDEHNVQVLPPGFHVIFLPFADDFRKLDFSEIKTRASTEQVDKAKEIVKKLQFVFSSENFENPTLQRYYANVEAMALDTDQPEEVEDYTMPNDEKMQKRAGRLLEEFKDLVFPEGYTPGVKRKAETVDVDVQQEARAGKLSKLTVPTLKDYCKKANVRCGGTKKADLINAINSHLGL